MMAPLILGAAYVSNFTPSSGSKRSIASIKPNMPELIRSPRSRCRGRPDFVRAATNFTSGAYWRIRRSRTARDAVRRYSRQISTMSAVLATEARDMELPLLARDRTTQTSGPFRIGSPASSSDHVHARRNDASPRLLLCPVLALNPLHGSCSLDNTKSGCATTQSGTSHYCASGRNPGNLGTAGEILLGAGALRAFEQ
jgi:hypothetical protein